MAEGRYTRIKSKFWTDEKARKWDSETKFLALYLLTSPHNNILGCYVLPKLYICADLGWDDKQLGKPFNKLLQDGFIKYDDINCLILLCNYLKHNPIENGNQATGAIKQLDELPKSPLLQELKQLIEQLGKPFLKPLAERIGKPVTVTVTETVTVTTTTPISPSTEKPEPNFEPEELESRSRQVIESYEKEFGRLLSPTEIEMLDQQVKEVDPDLIIYALKQAVLSGKRQFSYIRGILSNWNNAGVKCIQDVDELERQHEEQKRRQAAASNNRASPKTTELKNQAIDQFFGLEATGSG
jgi:DnaD/phage-associated family protein